MRHVGDRERDDLGLLARRGRGGPPLIRDRCLRTVLSPPIGAPERSRARVTCRFWAKGNVLRRRGPVREPPPGQQQQHRIVGVAPRAYFQLSSAPFIRPHRHRVSGLDHLDPPGRHAMADGG